ncbi:UNVERIFIED_ORG: hypothetical protein GGD51_005134 [Rhizobium esperanzae]
MKFAAGRRFPTRRYPYREPESGVALDTSVDPLNDIPKASFVRYFLGRDDRPEAIETADVPKHVNDPFAQLILAAGFRPLTLLDILDYLNQATGPNAVSGQRLYRVADGGQIPWDAATANLDRHLRLVVTRHRGEEAELFISSAPPFDSAEIFLQVFAWDPVSGAYNFYERRRGIWSWAGSSWEAFDPQMRGLGPFDSHVSGAPVMKELKLPWMHWHSQSALILDNILAPDDPLHNDPFYHGSELRGGEDLELIVRAGVSRWTRSRFDRSISGGMLKDAKLFFRHILSTTTVNLVTSPQQGAFLGDGEMLRLPTSFFLNSDCLLDELGLPATIGRPKSPGTFYLDCLTTYGVELKDGPVTLARDTPFAFAVPEPAFEDRTVLAELIRRGALSRRLAASLLMVDFTNPVFSIRREKLHRYIPEEIALDGGQTLNDSFVAAVQASSEAAEPGSVEAEFLTIWSANPAAWQDPMVAAIESYWTNLLRRLTTAAGFDEVFRLSESRRRQFRKSPLAEFGLTLAVAAKLEIPVPLQMTEKARVIPNPPTEDQNHAIV